MFFQWQFWAQLPNLIPTNIFSCTVSGNDVDIHTLSVAGTYKLQRGRGRGHVTSTQNSNQTMVKLVTVAMQDVWAA